MQNALQAMSNAAADTVAGPVDALSWILRKAGVPVPQNALGSSAWMAQQGLTAPVKPGVSQVVGETLGLLSPVAAAAKAPQIARGLLQAERAIAPKVADMAEQYMARTGMMQPATVYHGSPHKFDKFDSSKIGTGEGAQAYGHGLYLAESPGVAQSYKDALSGINSFPGGNKATNPTSLASRLAAMFGDDGTQWTRNGRNIGDMAKKLSKRTENVDGGGVAYVLKDGSHFVSGPGGLWWDVADGSWSPQGNLYKVDLPDSAISRMLDWDKPLSQQAPEVQRALAKVMPTEGQTWMHGAVSPKPVTDAATLEQLNKLSKSNPSAIDEAGYYLGSPALTMTGKDVHFMLGGRAINSGGVGEQTLRQAGIPGIKYLDGGSRGAGTGTSNFVIFPGEESLLTILERNGVPVNALQKVR